MSSEKARMEADRLVKLKLVMDATVIFPTEYLFKFIVPATEVHLIIIILSEMEVDKRPSSNGKYISVTGKKVFASSDEIIAIYQSASVIQGIISL